MVTWLYRHEPCGFQCQRTGEFTPGIVVKTCIRCQQPFAQPLVVGPRGTPMVTLS